MQLGLQDKEQRRFGGRRNEDQVTPADLVSFLHGWRGPGEEGRGLLEIAEIYEKAGLEIKKATDSVLARKRDRGLM